MIEKILDMTTINSYNNSVPKSITAYRYDLTVLRAFAVLAVVMFHSGFNWASGGYIGVDIFFVLSGYLITESIKSTIEKEQFSFLSYYLQRFLRILPAAITVIVITGLVGSKILLPEEIIELFASIRSNLYLQGNVWASKSVNYFGIGVEFKPLIHYWSLSIELQYYIFFPVIIAVLVKADRINLLKSIVFTIFTASLVYAWINVENSPNKSYFSSLMRAWEFSLGIIICLYRREFLNLSHRAQTSLFAIGYVLIFSAIFLFDANSKFPGPLALIPCLGVALVIVFGGRNFFSAKSIFVNPLIYIGNISFSLYLVHQPIMAFCRIILGRELEGVEVYGLIFLSGFAGALLYAWIEKPFRIRTINAKSKIRLLLICVLGIALYSTSSFYANRPIEKYPISSGVEYYLKYRYDNNPRVQECRGMLPESACLYGKEDSPIVALWGDSHADQLVSPLHKAIELYDHSVMEFAMPGCPPITDIQSEPAGRSCSAHSKIILKYIASNKKITHVILHAYWTGYFDGQLISSQKNPAESFRDVLITLLNSGKKVHIIYPVPKMKVNPPLYLARRELFSKASTIPSITFDEFISQSTVAMKFLKESTSGLDVNHIYISDFLLDPDRMVYFSAGNGKVYYRDDNHLSVSGGELVAKPIADKIFAH